MAVELAVGYISLVADASRIPGAVDRALGNAGRNADAQGETIGRRMATGIGTALKAGVVTAAVAAGGIIGTALTKGFGRLTAIDDAQGKLRGLGHDAASIKMIMDSALASVKGTAFGLGDAATVAATAVAAGIQPGQQLTNYLKLIADAATIAGSSLGEMGSIINQTTTGGIVFTDTLNQLADRGLPVFTWLQKETKLSGAEFRKFVEEGKLDAQTFQRVLTQHLSGAALESGKTVTGSLANVNAALSRLGAAALKPTFGRLVGWFGQLTSALDKATSKVGPFAEKLDQQLFKKIIPQIQKMWQSFSASGGTEALAAAAQQAITVFSGLASSAKNTALAVVSIGKSLGEASAALGVSSWQVLLKVLESVSQIADSVLVPALQTLAGLMSSNQGVVTALIAAWLAFKTVPRVVGAVGTAVTAVQTRAVAAATGLRGIATATGAVVSTARAGSVTMGRFGSAIAQIGTHAPVIGRMQSAFVGAAATATRFGRSAGVAAAAVTGLRSAASGLLGALGGPWVLGVIAAAVAIVKFTSDMREHAQQVKAVKDAWSSLAKTRGDLSKTIQSEGGIGEQSIGNITEQVAGLNDAIDKAAKNKAGFWSTRNLFKAPWNDTIRNENFAADQYKAAQDAIEKLGMSNQRIAESLVNEGSWNQLKAQLEGMGNGGKFAAENLQWLRDEALRVQAIAQSTTPGFFALSDAVKTLADRSATATDQLDAMKAALDALAGVPVNAQDALARYNDQVRETAALATQFDPSKGFGDALVADGKIDTATENGRQLYNVLKSIRDATLDAAVAGNDLAPILAKNQTQFEQLATATGLPKEQIEALAASIGYLPSTIEILTKLKGATDVEQKLVVISELLKTNSSGIEIPMELLNDGEVKAKLTEAGVKIDEVNGKPGIVKLSAPDAQKVLADLDQIINKNLPSKTQQVNVVYNDPGLNIETRKRLHENIDDIQIAPRADGGIDGLPGQATIQSPRANLIQWAEPSTGGEAFIPLAASKRGRSMQILSQVADHFGVGLTQFAEGGSTVPLGVSRALKAARSLTGTKYKWAGTSPSEGFDCSGFIGYLQLLLMGVVDSTRRLYTTTSLLAGQTSGLKSGLGPAGTWFRVGVNAQHMAGTLAGQPVESGGSHGDARIGSPAVGATDSQFTAKFYLPNELIDGINDAGVSADTSSTYTGGSGKKKNTWTESDELDLKQAELDLDEAKRDRDKVYADEKSSDLDKRRADLNVQKAEQDLIDKQEEKDGKLTGTGATPEAPALTNRLSDDEITRQRAQLSVDEARESRNETYADPEATDTDKRKADLDYQAALNARDETDKTKTVTGTIQQRLQTYASDVVGILFQAFRDQLPFNLGQSRYFDIEYTTTETDTSTSTSSSGSTYEPPAQSFSDDEVNQQFPVTLGDDARKALEPYINQAPLQIQEWVKQLPLKVYDSGGWLKPGEAALNLSSRPEPIFNSPDQMRQFMGGAELAAGQPPVNDFSINLNNPTFSDGMAGAKQLSRYQELQMMRHAGRP